MVVDFNSFGQAQLTVNPDGSILKDGKMLGIANNPGYIIDSTELKGQDGYTVTDTGTYNRFFGGSAVRADGPNKKIVETAWIQAGVLRDNIIISMVFKADVLPGGIAISGYETFLKGYIIRRDPKTKQETMRNPITFVYTQVAEDTGMAARAGWGSSHSIDFFQFNDKYEYKIELFTDDKLDTNQSLIVDYMYFTYMQRTGIYRPNQIAFGADPVTEPVYILQNVYTACSTDANGNGTINIDQRHIGASATNYNEMCAIFNDIHWVGWTTNAGGADSSFGYDVTWSPGLVHNGPGYGVQIFVYSSTVGSGTLYGNAIIIGAVNPSVV